jgi:hypothetical protein
MTSNPVSGQIAQQRGSCSFAFLLAGFFFQKAFRNFCSQNPWESAVLQRLAFPCRSSWPHSSESLRSFAARSF